MAFTDWEFFTDTGVSAAHDTVTPLLGTGSFITVASGTGNRGLSGNVTVASGITQGMTRGRIRSVINVDAFVAGYRIGFYCMASQKDITSSGSFYSLSVHTRTSLAIDAQLELRKHTPGLFSYLLLTETTNNPSSINEFTDIVVELEWQADVVNLGGTRLVGRAALGTSFGSLVKHIDYVDTTGPYTSSVSEGIMGQWFTTGESMTARLDNTEIISQALV